MVDPITDAERERTMRWAKVALVLLVAVSAGLITSQGDASLEIVLGAVVVGLVVGVALVWLLFPNVADVSPASNRRRRN